MTLNFGNVQGKKMFAGCCMGGLLAVLLAACGGGSSSGAGAPPERLLTSGTTTVAAGYQDSVQQLYVAYFGRPADGGGLANFEAQLATLGAPTSIQQLDAAYHANPAIGALVDSFGVSAESQALYSGDTTAFVTAIYTNVLNRAPDTEGLKYWVNAIDNAGLKRGNAALSIMAGALANSTAQGKIDGVVINNKIAVASGFTTTVPLASYRGDGAAALARAMLAGIDQNSSAASFATTIANTVKAIAAAAGSIYAGNYSGSYGGDDLGNFTFTVAKDGTITGSGKSSVFGTLLVITGSLGTSNAASLPLQGTIGPFTFTGTIDAGTGKLTGTWGGNGAKGTLGATRISS